MGRVEGERKYGALLDSSEDPYLLPSFIHSLPSWGKLYIWGEPWIQVAGASQPVDHLTLAVNACAVRWWAWPVGVKILDQSHLAVSLSQRYRHSPLSDPETPMYNDHGLFTQPQHANPDIGTQTLTYPIANRDTQYCDHQSLTKEHKSHRYPHAMWRHTAHEHRCEQSLCRLTHSSA